MGAITPVESAEVKFRFRAGYAQHYDSTMIRCDYANTTCYKAKGVAMLKSMDVHTGYTTGRQNITVKGHGFNTNDI